MSSLILKLIKCSSNCKSPELLLCISNLFYSWYSFKASCPNRFITTSSVEHTFSFVCYSAVLLSVSYIVLLSWELSYDEQSFSRSFLFFFYSFFFLFFSFRFASSLTRESKSSDLGGLESFSYAGFAPYFSVNSIFSKSG
jgi:hypothetical protein